MVGPRSPEFVSVRDAVGILGLSKREVYRLVAAGELDSSPYGRRKLIDPDSLAKLAARIRAGAFAKEAA